MSDPRPSPSADPEAPADDALTVGQLAELAGVTVRTLHHYDAIGLLSPASRTHGGRRIYAACDVARLQRILFYRELELPLDRIAAIVDDPEADDRDHLRRQHASLTERITRLQRVRDAVTFTLEAHEMSIDLTPQERLEVFGDDDPARYDAEAHARWGDTDAFRESRRRTATYAREDWAAVKAEGDALLAAFAAVMAAGHDPAGPQARAVAERARAHIDARFYPLSHEMHRGLADLYVSDSRFAATYEAAAAGLARYVRDAIHANADDHAARARDDDATRPG